MKQMMDKVIANVIVGVGCYAVFALVTWCITLLAH